MMLDSAMPFLGPVVLAINIATMFFCMRPKRGKIFTIAVLAAFTAAVQPLLIFFAEMNSPIARYLGIIYLPLMLFLFKGQMFQKVFAVMMPYQLGALPTHLADAITGVTIGYDSPHAITIYVVLSLIMLGLYMTLVVRFGRRILERMFAGGDRAEWALYSLGAIFSWIILLTLNWMTVGDVLYFFIVAFILWSNGVLCFTIISTHEKAAQAHNAETLVLQMKAMSEQSNAEKKHRDDIQILRHDMRHEMGVIMELVRTGKTAEAEAVYSGWQRSLDAAAPETFCAEPMLNAVFSRFAQRAKEKEIHLYVNSNVPEALPIDTIKLSVMASNALENALTATDKVADTNKRTIRVKLIVNDAQIGLEVTNPCVESVEFDEKGLPMSRAMGHGIGTRSIAAFADAGGYLLNFSCLDGKFSMQLIMRV